MINEKINELVITRIFDAPKELIFKTLTEAKHLANWWGPKGLQLEVISIDVKPGGIFHYAMKSPDGQEMYGVFNYIEVVEPDKLVFTNSFADKFGHPIRAPFSEVFPIKIHNTWTLYEVAGKTTLILKGMPYEASEEEHTFFENMYPSMNEGFAGTFDQLDIYLKTKFQLYTNYKTDSKARVTTYLNFPGKTEEAFNFYKNIFKGEFTGEGLKRFGDIEMPAEYPPMDEETKRLIIFAELTILGGHVLMATDSPESMGFKMQHGNNMHINLEPENKEETKRLFDALSAEGNITMPLQDMFWGSYFGTCVDKYGINWMFSFTQK